MNVSGWAAMGQRDRREPVPSHEVLERARRDLRAARDRTRPRRRRARRRDELVLFAAAVLVVMAGPWALAYHAATGASPGTSVLGLLPVLALAALSLLVALWEAADAVRRRGR